MQPWEIWWGQTRWKDCADRRPWLIVDCRPDDAFGCFPISTKSYGDPAFELSADHPDFAATGLKRTCFIHDLHIIELHAAELHKRSGTLGGQLRDQFRAYADL